jgi:glutamyl-Q tRNA(Asp) synthetase
MSSASDRSCCAWRCRTKVRSGRRTSSRSTGDSWRRHGRSSGTIDGGRRGPGRAQPARSAKTDAETGGAATGQAPGSDPSPPDGRRAALDRRPAIARSALPDRPTTRFAPAPTGYLHLGHALNAIYVWGTARAAGGRVLLRIEDHDRQRCRPALEEALLDDLDWLGLTPDEPSTEALRAGPSPYRQSDSTAAYEDALDRLAAAGLVHACDCSRATFARWRAVRGTPWSGPGCPGHCADRGLRPGPDIGLRISLGDGVERVDDLLEATVIEAPSRQGDLLVRDRHGDWTYPFAVVVDDIREGIDLVVRGADLIDATARQIRLGRLLGRVRPPVWSHHPLIRRPDGSKLSKADGDTGIRDLRADGWSPGRVLGEAAAAVGLIRPGRRIGVADLAEIVVRPG